MNPRTTCLYRLKLLSIIALAGNAILAFAATSPAQKEASPAESPFRKAGLKRTRDCMVGQSVGFLADADPSPRRYLSPTQDYDCDGIADRFDNCVGMANPDQIDRDGNEIGDVCEEAATVRVGATEKSTARVEKKPREKEKVAAERKREPVKKKSSPTDRTSRAANDRRRR